MVALLNSARGQVDGGGRIGKGKHERQNDRRVDPLADHGSRAPIYGRRVVLRHGRNRYRPRGCWLPRGQSL